MVLSALFEKAVKSTQSISPIPAAKGSFPAGFDRPEYYEAVTVPGFLSISPKKPVFPPSPRSFASSFSRDFLSESMVRRNCRWC
jgi:hypothetical protein